MWKSPLKQRVTGDSNAEAERCRVELASNSPIRTGPGEVAAAERRLPRLQSRQIGVEMSDGLDAAEIIFKGKVFIGGVGVFVR